MFLLLATLTCFNLAISAAESGVQENETGSDGADQVHVTADESVTEELVVEGEAIDPMDAEFENYMRYIYYSRRTGERLYRLGKYREAFPHLEASAMAGFKLAQARLGYIFLHGFNVVKKDPETAIGWLGVAAHGTTDPAIKRYYKKVWAGVRDELKPYMSQIVNAYVETYGSKATEVNCEMTREAGTHISRYLCDFQVRADLLGLANESRAGGFTALPSAPPILGGDSQ